MSAAVKASLFFLNDVFYDTLESTIENNKIENAVDLEYEVGIEQKNAIPAKINGYLFISKSQTQINQPGCVFTGTDDSSECVKCAKDILNNCLMTEDIRNQVREEGDSLESQEAKKMYNAIFNFLFILSFFFLIRHRLYILRLGASEMISYGNSHNIQKEHRVIVGYSNIKRTGAGRPTESP